MGSDEMVGHQVWVEITTIHKSPKKGLAVLSGTPHAEFNVKVHAHKGTHQFRAKSKDFKELHQYVTHKHRRIANLYRINVSDDVSDSKDRAEAKGRRYGDFLNGCLTFQECAGDSVFCHFLGITPEQGLYYLLKNAPKPSPKKEIPLLRSKTDQDSKQARRESLPMRFDDLVAPPDFVLTPVTSVKERRSSVPRAHQKKEPGSNTGNLVDLDTLMYVLHDDSSSSDDESAGKSGKEEDDAERAKERSDRDSIYAELRAENERLRQELKSLKLDQPQQAEAKVSLMEAKLPPTPPRSMPTADAPRGHGSPLPHNHIVRPESPMRDLSPTKREPSPARPASPAPPRPLPPLAPARRSSVTGETAASAAAVPARRSSMAEDASAGEALGQGVPMPRRRSSIGVGLDASGQGHHESEAAARKGITTCDSAFSQSGPVPRRRSSVGSFEGSVAVLLRSNTFPDNSEGVGKHMVISQSRRSSTSDALGVHQDSDSRPPSQPSSTGAAPAAPRRLSLVGAPPLVPAPRRSSVTGGGSPIAALLASGARRDSTNAAAESPEVSRRGSQAGIEAFERQLHRSNTFPDQSEGVGKHIMAVQPAARRDSTSAASVDAPAAQASAERLYEQVVRSAEDADSAGDPSSPSKGIAWVPTPRKVEPEAVQAPRRGSVASMEAGLAGGKRRSVQGAEQAGLAGSMGWHARRSSDSSVSSDGIPVPACLVFSRDESSASVHSTLEEVGRSKTFPQLLPRRRHSVTSGAEQVENVMQLDRPPSTASMEGNGNKEKEVRKRGDMPKIGAAPAVDTQIEAALALTSLNAKLDMEVHSHKDIDAPSPAFTRSRSSSSLPPRPLVSGAASPAGSFKKHHTSSRDPSPDAARAPELETTTSLQREAKTLDGDASPSPSASPAPLKQPLGRSPSPELAPFPATHKPPVMRTASPELGPSPATQKPPLMRVGSPESAPSPGKHFSGKLSPEKGSSPVQALSPGLSDKKLPKSLVPSPGKHSNRPTDTPRDAPAGKHFGHGKGSGSTFSKAGPLTAIAALDKKPSVEEPPTAGLQSEGAQSPGPLMDLIPPPTMLHSSTVPSQSPGRHMGDNDDDDDALPPPSFAIRNLLMEEEKSGGKNNEESVENQGGDASQEPPPRKFVTSGTAPEGNTDDNDERPDKFETPREPPARMLPAIHEIDIAYIV